VLNAKVRSDNPFCFKLVLFGSLLNLLVPAWFLFSLKHFGHLFEMAEKLSVIFRFQIFFYD